MKDKLFAVLILCLLAAVGVQAYFLYHLNEQFDSSAAVSQSNAGITIPDLNKWNPGAEMQRMQARIDRLFNNAFSQLGTNFGGGNPFLDNHISPRLDLQDQGDHYKIEINLPGAERSEIHVGIKNDRVLTINATTREDKGGESGDILHRERFVGRYQRTLTLPQPVDPGTMHSKYHDGVLTLTVKKAVA